MENTKTQAQAVKKLYTFVIGEMKKGAKKYEIADKLIGMGMDRENSDKFVETVYEQALKTAEKEQPTPGSIIPALIGAALAAVIGGAIWGLIIVLTGYEIGYMATGIGFLCGFAVVKFTGNKKGIPLQFIAVAFSIVGIVIGKYFSYFHFLKDAVLEQYGAETASAVTVFSPKVIQYFAEGITSMLSPFDILWAILAIISAWSLTKSIGIKVEKDHQLYS